MLTLGAALRQGTELLAQGGIAVPRLTAEVLLAHATHRDRAYLYAHSERPLSEVEWIHYGRYLHERLARKPTQYITHTQEFYGRSFYVSPAVLIPRPETEFLVELALQRLPRAAPIIDVGTGSGAIAITVALESRALDRSTSVIGVDISPAALAVAVRNARSLDASVSWIAGDGLAAISDASAGLILSNPPYIAEADRESLPPEVGDWEPQVALFSGTDGLEFYRRLIPEAARVLEPRGSLVLEVGAGQSAEVRALFPITWEDIGSVKDLAGIDRVLHARKKF